MQASLANIPPGGLRPRHNEEGHRQEANRVVAVSAIGLALTAANALQDAAAHMTHDAGAGS